MKFAVNLALDLPLHQTYSYLSLEPLANGVRVMVEFRGKEQIGFVISCQPVAQFKDYSVLKLKPIRQISPAEFSLPPHLIQLCEFAAKYYHHPLGSTLFCALPALLRKAGIPLLKPAKSKKLDNKASDTDTPPPLNPEQQSVLTRLQTHLNHYHVGVLYGITGSGKTEVFLHLIALVLTQGQQVLVLVPEINLTPQLAQRFKQRFPQAKINIMNSEISNKQRLNTWLEAKNGQAELILGTRLSVFTPFTNLGLIIVDEEHDDSFKQNDSLRYHARDLAVWRAKQAQVPIILSSATPSLETLYNFKLGKFALYTLTTRAIKTAQLPQIELINLHHNPPNSAGISPAALAKLKACLARQELALVFINRRGYAPSISCYECGWVSACHSCSSKLVYHHAHKHLKCHHCGYQTKVPLVCPICQNQYLHTIGQGTQKLEEYLATQFPQAHIRRVDRDTTTSKNAWQKLYQEIDNLDILVGTQMLAKGHDFARLTLVIGLNLDNALFSYDFRASAVMFNTLTQVSGRAGRATAPGTVLLQTNYPDHPLYKFLKDHDFNGFINYTLHERQQHGLPPFSHYALLKISCPSEAKLTASLKKLRELSKQITLPAEVHLFPPLPAVMLKLHNKFRGQMLISSKNRSNLHHYLTQLSPHLTNLTGCSLALDVDPVEL